MNEKTDPIEIMLDRFEGGVWWFICVLGIPFIAIKLILPLIATIYIGGR